MLYSLKIVILQNTMKMEDLNTAKLLEIKTFIHALVLMCGLYGIWIILHYASAHLYVYWCVPATLVGFLSAPFLVPAPHCQALRWAIYNGGNSIMAMWFIMGAWCMRYITPIPCPNT